MRKPEQAAEVLRQRSERSDSSRLYGLEPLVLHAMGAGMKRGRRPEARSSASEGQAQTQTSSLTWKGSLQIDPK
jgi:hypothetical protein